MLMDIEQLPSFFSISISFFLVVDIKSNDLTKWGIIIELSAISKKLLFYKVIILMACLMNKQFRKYSQNISNELLKLLKMRIFTANVSNFMSYKNYTIFLLLCSAINHEQKLQSILPTIYFLHL